VLLKLGLYLRGKHTGSFKGLNSCGSSLIRVSPAIKPCLKTDYSLLNEARFEVSSERICGVIELTYFCTPALHSVSVNAKVMSGLL
jgi:hypothetical protein